MGVGSTLSLAYELKILQVTQGRSRSFKMVPIDRSYIRLYVVLVLVTYIAVVRIALSCTIFELFDVQNIVTLKPWLKTTRGH